MKKTIILSLVLFVLMSAFGSFIYIDSHRWAPTDFKVTRLAQTDASIPQNFDNVSVLFISDLEYGNYFDREKLLKLQDIINTLDCDIILFGGDLFDKDYSPFSDDVTLLSSFLENMKARLGKFCILGDFDTVSESRTALVNRIFKAGNFETVSGVVPLYNGSANSFINLVGYSCNETIDSAQNLKGYGIAMIHGTSQYDKIDDTVDFVLSGHAHEWQINSPFKKHDYSLYENGRLYITSGVGMSESATRLFCDPQLLYIRLKCN